MMRARVAYAGAIHEAYPEGDLVRLADGRVREQGEVVWLAPVEVGTIFALGLNYAEHA
ncbi:MAG TPA: 2-hydroxyhepta-2,4-diene-1,7-dioate isomerase, partial [Paraburkholderia sp.]|nr:2-hydroxyhepta-2,4-diene-1,7-dioate isomerase [Paraburkholderia sp.]